MWGQSHYCRFQAKLNICFQTMLPTQAESGLKPGFGSGFPEVCVKTSWIYSKNGGRRGGGDTPVSPKSKPKNFVTHKSKELGEVHRRAPGATLQNTACATRASARAQCLPPNTTGCTGTRANNCTCLSACKGQLEHSAHSTATSRAESPPHPPTPRSPPRHNTLPAPSGAIL